MARADLLTNLVKAERTGDRAAFKRTVESLIADERSKRHNVLADRLASILNDHHDHGHKVGAVQAGWDNRINRLVHQIDPERKLTDLVLPRTLSANVSELIEEQHRSDLLRAHGEEPRHRVMCIGPPGTGKTSLAEAIAFELMVPMIVVRYEGLIGKYLGETNDRLRAVIEFASTRKCVLFFDEFDAIGKERGDANDSGEIKRVVSSLLLQLDALPSHVVVVVASNHDELLDRAVWRRFELRLCLPMPSRKQRISWFSKFENQLNSPLGLSPRTLADKLNGLSFAELEDFTRDVRRRCLLESPDADIPEIVKRKLGQWQARPKAPDQTQLNG
ncbi:MAG: ATP-binding protein [Pseudomonadota bacterium]